MKKFTTKTKDRKVVEFELDGETFSFTSPKRAKLVLGMLETTDDASAGIAATRDMFDWLGQGLSDEQGQRILDRLRDPDDELDMEEVNDLIRWLISEVTGRPTKPQ